MHLIAALLVIIILLLGGWWIFAVGLGLVAAAIGAVIAAVVWIFRTLWPVLALGLAGFALVGLGGIVLEGRGRGGVSRADKEVAETDHPTLPPISRTWAARKQRGTIDQAERKPPER